MKPIVRALAAVGLSVSVFVLTGEEFASAQEMEHGRTRPASRELTSNVVKTHEAVMSGYANAVRG